MLLQLQAKYRKLNNIPSSFSRRRQNILSGKSNTDTVYYGDIHSKNKLESTKKSEISLLIGPEGGWSTSELLWLKNNFRGVSFSTNVLRVETAAIVASGILLS